MTHVMKVFKNCVNKNPAEDNPPSCTSNISSTKMFYDQITDEVFYLKPTRTNVISSRENMADSIGLYKTSNPYLVRNGTTIGDSASCYSQYGSPIYRCESDQTIKGKMFNWIAICFWNCSAGCQALPPKDDN